MKVQEEINNRLLRRIRTCIWLIIVGLSLSGITAFPIETELHWLTGIHHSSDPFHIHIWLMRVYQAVRGTNFQYPYLSYGTDWLAFAHLMLAILFWGALKDPVQNRWVIKFGIIASVCIFPLAFIAGDIRDVPVFWRLIDCSFGVVTLAILLPCYRMTDKLRRIKNVY